MLDTRKTGAHHRGRVRALTGRRQFNLLIVRGDGTRLVQFSYPRGAALGALVGVLVVVFALGAIVGDWVQLRALALDARSFQHRIAEHQHQIAEQRATLESFQQRAAQIGREVASWRTPLARILEPLGPEVIPGGRDRGIGGGSLQSPNVQAKIGPGTELDRLAEAVKEQSESLRVLERLMTRAGKALAALPSRWPVRGAVNSEFGRRTSPWSDANEFHGGIDIRATKGTLVRAPAPGKVVFAGTQTDYGVTVILDHGHALRTVYGHLSKTKVKTGDTVDRGAVIALTGNTGRSSGPHLHYEILVSGKSVNPRVYLWD